MHPDIRMVRYRPERLGVCHEVYLVRSVGYLAEVTVLHGVERLQYLKYLKLFVFECVADLYCFVPVLRVFYRFLLRVCDMALYAR